MPILSLFVGAHEYFHGRQWVIFIASAAMQPVRRTTVVTIHRRGVIFLIRRREYRDYWSVRRRRRGKQITAVLKRVRQIIFRRFKRCLPSHVKRMCNEIWGGVWWDPETRLSFSSQLWHFDHNAEECRCMNEDSRGLCHYSRHVEISELGKTTSR